MKKAPHHIAMTHAPMREEPPPSPHSRVPLAIFVFLTILLFGGSILFASVRLSHTAVSVEDPEAALAQTEKISKASFDGPILSHSPGKKEETSHPLPRLKPVNQSTDLQTNTQPTSNEPSTKTVAIVLPEKTYKDPKFWPTLKPSRRAGAIKSTNFQFTHLDPLATHPINLQPFIYADEQDFPPKVFATDALYTGTTQTNQRQANTQIPFGDVKQAPTNLQITLKRGENFVDMLKRAQVRREDRNAAVSAIANHIKLRSLQAGTEFLLTVEKPNMTWFQDHLEPRRKEANYLLSLKMSDAKNGSKNRIVSLRRNKNDTFTATASPIKISKRLTTIRGTIHDNLYISMRKQGAPDSIVDDLANVFAFDVDFQRDIFQNDQFEAIYEVWYDDKGQIIGGGDLIFASLAWRGQTRKKDYYLHDPKSKTLRTDYFTQNGESARRLLMKTPIDGARLSSRFGPRRHPILGYRKTHKGVDFAARRGTPIKATGNGVIERANRYGSFGNYVRIRHANNYKTAYAHLKGFARGIKKGRRVRQGDIIGYVGTTGRSTGPHLHYEVHHKGRAVNPQRLKIATGVKLNGKDLEAFKIRRDIINGLRLKSQNFAKNSGQSTSTTGSP